MTRAKSVQYNQREFEPTVRFVSPALKHVVFPALSRSGYLRHSLGSGPGVVTYHGVFPRGYQARHPSLDGNLVHADSLRRQLSLLQRRYHIVTPDDFLRHLDGEIALPERSVLLTCDDARRNTTTEMVPILSERGLRSLFFATGASLHPAPSMLWYEELYLMMLDAALPLTLRVPEAEIDLAVPSPRERHAGWWKLVERLSLFDLDARRQFLERIRAELNLPENWKDRFIQDPVLAARFLTLDVGGLRDLLVAGMTVGAHTLSHPIVARMSPELAAREISECRTLFEDALGQRLWAFAYPFGNADTVSRRDVDLASQSGFRCAFMNDGGGFGAPINRWAIPRVHVTADMTLAEFEAHLTGFYRSLRAKLLGASVAAFFA